MTDDTRLEAGNQKQVDIFGEGMKDFYKKGNEKQDISTSGLRPTVSEIITRETDLTIRQEK